MDKEIKKRFEEQEKKIKALGEVIKILIDHIKAHEKGIDTLTETIKIMTETQSVIIKTLADNKLFGKKDLEKLGYIQ